MPELPEVEAVARALRPLVRGRRIRCAHVFHPIAIRPQHAGQFAKDLEGKRIQEVERAGKYLFLQLERGFLEMHFRLDGQLLWFSDGTELLDRANVAKDGVHVDIALELDKGVLGFTDKRHFGRLHTWRSREECQSLRKLGIDALSRQFTPKWFEERLSTSKRPLKEFLLDQSKIAGIGNIYSCESLWHARLDPRRRTNTVNRAESRKLHKAIVSVLHRALECCLDPSPDFRDPSWWFQGLERILRAYQREGLPCRRCGREIQRIEQGGRSTYFCPRCQK